MATLPIASRFPLGRIVATPAALAVLAEAQIWPSELIKRHANGDWGAVPPEDAEANAAALEHGSRLLSSYSVGPDPDTRVWVITEADRSVTTILLPSDY